MPGRILVEGACIVGDMLYVHITFARWLHTLLPLQGNDHSGVLDICLAVGGSV